MKDELITTYNAWDIERSTKYVLSLCDNSILYERERAADIVGEKFKKKIDLKKTLRGNFYYCDFTGTGFSNFDCSDYYFENCKLNDCVVENSNFKYLGMINSIVTGNNKTESIINSPFDYAILENSILENLNISSCNFKHIQIKDCEIKNLKIFASDFSGSIISNTVIDNIDFLNVDVQFVEFNNVTAQNVSFLITDILHCYYGIDMILHNSDKVHLKLFEDTKEISGTEFIKSLDDMMPYLYSINDFFSLANISIFKGNQKDSFNYILMGLKYNIEQKDFKIVHYLCKLASLTPLFSRKELKMFYEALKSNAIQSHLTRFEYRHYMNELSEIKHILIENPSNLINMVITINTMIDENDYVSLSNIIKTIDIAAERVIPQTSKSVSIRHNSPPVIEIFLNDSISSLISYFALLSAFLGCSIQIIKQIYALVIQKEELTGHKLSNELKRAELLEKRSSEQLTRQEIKNAEMEHQLLKEKLRQTEKVYEQGSTDSHISGNETINISYDLQSSSMDMPSNLRSMSIQINNIVKH